jgi:hypothetical protein
MVDALRDTYALPELFAELDMARSSYFYHRARLRVADKYGDVCRTIADIFALNHRCYGYHRIPASLCRQHVFISEKVVLRLMKQECLIVAAKSRRHPGPHRARLAQDGPQGRVPEKARQRRVSQPAVASVHGHRGQLRYD